VQKFVLYDPTLIQNTSVMHSRTDTDRRQWYHVDAYSIAVSASKNRVQYKAGNESSN